ncbi:MAG: sulfatase-like hydrolase/transferase [Dehalococcoidia bacterium]|nr:sulfatase-like hydrolase/transferase [Dehalococcoidia bacterium]
MKRALVLHPFIVAVFPSLALYTYNTQELSLSELVLPFAIALALAALMLLCTWLVLRSIYKAALIVSLFLALLYSTAYIFTLTGWLGVDSPYLGWMLLALIWVLFYPFLLYLIARTSKVLRYPTIILNVAMVVMLLISVVRIGTYEFQRMGSGVNLSDSYTELQLDVSEYEIPPDIYYIVLERYANAGTLSEVYDSDNSDFLNELTAQGFYVANESCANYVRTSESLASSLNMEHIDYMDEDSSDLLPLNEKLEDNALQRLLQAVGYKFIHVGSWWGPLRENKYADVNVNYCARADMFSEYILTATMPYTVSTELGIIDDLSMRQWKRTRFEFEELARIPEEYEETPTFTFAHLMISHPPYTFDEDGIYLSPEEAGKNSNRDNYMNALTVTNEMVMDLVEELKSTSAVPPIIILQADEGPYPERYRAGDRTFSWAQATDMEVKEKMGILNAYYLPGVEYGDTRLYSSISPVNSFRLVFDLYFGTNLGLLEDSSYVYTNYSLPYEFLDVTERLRS